MKQLFVYKNTLQDFVMFCNEYGYPIKGILQATDYRFVLGYLLEYLESKGIFCLVDNYNILIFTCGIDDKTRAYVEKHKSVYILKESSNNKERGVIDNYIYAIDKAFNFLETPF